MATLPGYKALVNMAAPASVADVDLALTDAGDHTTFTVPLASTKRYLDRAVAVAVQTQCDEVQTVTITGSPTGGNFTLTFGGNTTSTIAYNASAATVLAALVALASIGANNVSVSGPNGGPWVVEFIGAKANANQAAMTKNAAGLTGGSSPDVSIVETQAGSGWATLGAAAYTLRYLTAQVVLVTPLIGSNIACRLHAFNYYPYASVAQAYDISFAGARQMLDTTNLQGASGTGWHSFIPGLLGGTFACKEWMLASGATIYLAHMTAADLLILSFVSPDGTHAFESYCRVSQTNWHAAVNGLGEEDLTFQCDSVIALI